MRRFPVVRSSVLHAPFRPGILVLLASVLGFAASASMPVRADDLLISEFLTINNGPVEDEGPGLELEVDEVVDPGQRRDPTAAVDA